MMNDINDMVYIHNVIKKKKKHTIVNIQFCMISVQINYTHVYEECRSTMSREGCAENQNRPHWLRSFPRRYTGTCHWFITSTSVVTSGSPNVSRD